MDFQIHDKHGRVYHLAVVEDEDWLCAKLWDDGSPVGDLHVVFQSSGEWEITNITLFDEVPEQVGRLRRLMLALTRRKRRKINYRNRGLGTALLQFVEERARQRQVKRIVGSVTKKDYAAWPELLNWYAKNGFVVKLIGDEQSEHRDVACISKDIALKTVEKEPHT